MKKIIVIMILLIVSISAYADNLLFVITGHVEEIERIKIVCNDEIKIVKNVCLPFIYEISHANYSIIEFTAETEFNDNNRDFTIHIYKQYNNDFTEIMYNDSYIVDNGNRLFSSMGYEQKINTEQLEFELELKKDCINAITNSIVIIE